MFRRLKHGGGFIKVFRSLGEAGGDALEGASVGGWLYQGVGQSVSSRPASAF